MNIPRNLRHYMRRRLSPYPAIFLPLMQLRPAHRNHLINDQTEIVIEGFPRSGNTFAVAAFRFAQHRPIAIAHHLHAPAQVIEGVRRGLPVLLVLRDPVDAVISQMIRHPGLSPEAGLREYVSFHRHLLPYRTEVTTAPFDQVTSDFGGVIDAVNTKFGTSFHRFDHTDGNVSAVFAIVDQMDRADRTRRSSVSTSTVARPTEARDRLKVQVGRQMSDPRLQPLVQSARTLWQRMGRASG